MNSGITGHTIEATSSSLDSTFCHIKIANPAFIPYRNTAHYTPHDFKTLYHQYTNKQAVTAVFQIYVSVPCLHWHSWIRNNQLSLKDKQSFFWKIIHYYPSVLSYCVVLKLSFLKYPFFDIFSILYHKFDYNQYFFNISRYKFIFNQVYNYVKTWNTISCIIDYQAVPHNWGKMHCYQNFIVQYI